MYALDRLAARAPTGPAGFLHANQAAYTQQVPGYFWPADAMIGTSRTMHRIVRHPDGTLDSVALDQDGENWFDSGAQSSVDFKVGRL